MTLRARVLAALALCGLLVGASTAILIRSARIAHESQELAAAATALRFQASDLQKLLLDIETGERGFVLTRDRSFLEPWKSGRAAFPTEARELVRASRPDPVARRLATRILRRGIDYIREFNVPLVRRAMRDPAAAREIARTGEGRRRVDLLRDLFRRFIAQQTLVVRRSREQALAALQRAERVAFISLGGSIPLLAVVGLALGTGVLAPVRRLREAAGRLERGDLDARAVERGAPELADLARAFNRMAASLEQSRGSLLARTVDLEEATEIAVAANRAKSDFLSRMSHELRTPLNAILGFGQLLELAELEPDDRESTQQILRAGRHLLGLVDEILDLARIEAGKLRISVEPVAVGPVLTEVEGLMRPLAAERSIVMRIDTAATLMVLADRQRLKQILLNLVSNAVKYNRHAGSVTVDVATGPDGLASVLVSDTGPGLEAKEIDLLFEPFERLAADAEANLEGSGLGLALSRRLAELMGGQLGVDSQPGDGSTFFVQLPVADEPAAHKDDRRDSGSSARTTVLCVDDNPANIALVERVLARRPGVDLISAGSGGLALELARAHPIDLVLLDLHLPDGDGSHVLKQLRADPATRGAPVVVVSADAGRQQKQAVLAAGATRFLAKPIDVVELLQVVDELNRDDTANGPRPPAT